MKASNIQQNSTHYIMKKIFTTVIVAALMCSCNTLKNYDRNEVAKNTNIQSIYADAQNGDEQGLGDLKWREIFTDPTLQALIEKALLQNTNMRDADLRIQELEYALKATKLAFMPTAAFSANGSVNKLFDPYNRDEYSSRTIGNSKTYAAAVNMGWQNVNFLQLRNQKKGAQVSVEQMRSNKQAVQCALVANVAKMYYTLSQLDEQIKLMQVTRENWKKYLDMEKLLMDAGQANTAAVASIEATYWGICQSVVTLENNRKILENNLSSLLGETAHHISSTSLKTFCVPSVVYTGAPISILSRRPDVRAAELTLAKAFYDVNNARSAFYPSLTLSASGQFTNNAGAIINPGMMIGNAIASLAQPLFTNGRLRAQLKISKAEMEIAANDFQQKIIEAGNEVNTAMVQIKSAQEMNSLIDNQVKALETALDATQKLYAHSGANYLNVITAQNSLLQAQMTQISNQMDAINATIEMYQALGGGAE